MTGWMWCRQYDEIELYGQYGGSGIFRYYYRRNRTMQHVDSATKIKRFHSSLRPSQSLHSRLNKPQHPLHSPLPDSLTVCIICKKKKIAFNVESNLPFSDLLPLMYRNLKNHLLKMYPDNIDKVQRVLKGVAGFESADGDINFDYRLSLGKGVITKSKFFYLLSSKGAGPVRFKIYNCLAVGGFSKVYLGRSLDNGQFYALKFIRKQLGAEDQSHQALFNEISIAKNTDHPFLVKMLQAFETKRFFCLVFEYCPGGELFYLLKRVKVMPQPMAKFYFLQILYGLQHLHSKKILYRDLKPENILVDADGNCKIVDFGLSKQVGDRGKTYSYCGSAQYMAPQMILRTGHSFAIDYYSVGALLYELVTGLPPYYTKNHQQLQENIVCQQLTFPMHVQLSSQVKDLLDKLLNKDQKYRLGSYIGIKEIMIHPWVGKVNTADIIDKKSEVPFVPNLQDYNFDASELGDDQEEFTALVRQDISPQNSEDAYQEYHKSETLSQAPNPVIDELIQEVESLKNSTVRQSRGPSPSSHINPFIKMKKNSSTHKLREIMKMQRSGFQDISNHSIRGHNSEEKRVRELIKLTPYLNIAARSPQKLQQLPRNKLRKMKVQRNRAEREQTHL